MEVTYIPAGSAPGTPPPEIPSGPGSGGDGTPDRPPVEERPDIYPVNVQRDFGLNVARGLISGMKSILITGHNPDVDTGTSPEDIWEMGSVYPFQDAPFNAEIGSSHSEDTVDGTGLRTARVIGLDENWHLIEEVVSLSGIDAVPLQKTYRRVNDVFGLSCGALGFNAGQVKLFSTGTGSTVQSMINVGDGRAEQALYTIPAGFTGYLLWATAGLSRTNATDTAEFRITIREASGPGPWITLSNISLAAQGGTFQSVNLPIPLRLPGKTDLRFTVIGTSANNTSVSCAVELLIVADDVTLF